MKFGQQDEEEDQEEDNSHFKMSKWEVMDKDEKMGKSAFRCSNIRVCSSEGLCNVIYDQFPSSWRGLFLFLQGYQHLVITINSNSGF